LVSDIPSGDGKLVNLFLRCNNQTDQEDERQRFEMKVSGGGIREEKRRV
jgi:hypothetical protein